MADLLNGWALLFFGWLVVLFATLGWAIWTGRIQAPTESERRFWQDRASIREWLRGGDHG